MHPHNTHAARSIYIEHSGGCSGWENFTRSHLLQREDGAHPSRAGACLLPHTPGSPKHCPSPLPRATGMQVGTGAAASPAAEAEAEAVSGVQAVAHSSATSDNGAGTTAAAPVTDEATNAARRNLPEQVGFPSVADVPACTCYDRILRKGRYKVRRSNACVIGQRCCSPTCSRRQAASIRLTSHAPHLPGSLADVPCTHPFACQNTFESKNPTPLVSPSARVSGAWSPSMSTRLTGCALPRCIA